MKKHGLAALFVQMGLGCFGKIVTLKWANTSRRETAGNGFCFPLVMASLVLSNSFWGFCLIACFWYFVICYSYSWSEASYSLTTDVKVELGHMLALDVPVR